MQIIFHSETPSVRIPCLCGNEMRLVGIEPHVKTGADIFTYECNGCNLVEVVPPSVVH
jgi:hypothetical protein